MSWNTTPVGALSGDVGNLWPYVVQFWEAIRERGIAVGGADTWAAQAHAYASGVLTSCTDNGDGTFTVGDSTADWRDTAGNLRWTGATPGANGVPEWSAIAFDVVIDGPDDPSISEVDPRKVLQAQISTQPSATTVRCSFPLGNFADRIAERVITAASDLVGRRYWVVRRDGDNWTRGFPSAPNCGAYATGVVTATAAGTLTSATGLQNRDAIDAAEAVDVVYMAASGRMQRGELTGIDGSTITYGGTTATPVVGARFYLIESGGVWRWNAAGGFLQAFYGGLVDGYKAHDLDDSVGVAGLPRHFYPVKYGQDSLSCPVDPTDVVIKDVDYYVPYDNVCDDGDVYVNPDIHKTFRGLWLEAMRLCASFVKPIDWTGVASDPLSPVIPTFTVATWLDYVGINNVSGTTGTHTGGSMPCALSVPHTPVNLWWSILDAYGRPILSGYEEDYDGAHLTNPLTGAFAAIHDGKACVATLGPTRVVPLRFGRMFEVVYFVPSLDGTPEAAILPPTDAHPGTWTIRPASTHYLMPDADGRVGDSTLARHAIADGDFARYAGDNFNDPGLPVLLPAGTDQPLAPYHNNAYVGARRARIQSAIDRAMRGTATGGSNRRLVVAGADFGALDFMPASNGLTHAFTASSGSTTGCTVPGVSGTALWASARFPGFAGPFVGFCFEVIVNGLTDFSDPAAVVERRLIATGTTGGAVTWAEATSVSVDGKTARIVEPFVLNPYKGRRLILTQPDGVTTATVTVEGSHGDTLFVSDPGFTVTAGTTFAPDPAQPRFSDVCKRVSGAWVTTASMGDDPRNPGTNPFLADARLNAEDHVTEYGLPRPNDATFGFQGGWQELYDAINALRKSPGVTPSLHADANFSRSATYHNVTSSWADYANYVINGNPAPPPAGDGPMYTNYYLNDASRYGSANPMALFSGSGQWTWTGSAWVVQAGWTGGVTRQSAKYTVTPPQAPWPKTVEFYNFAGSGYEVFDANGDAVLNGLWKLWDSASTTTATVTSLTLGSTAVPNQCAAPASSELAAGTFAGQTGSISHTRGYGVQATASLVAWQFKFLP